MLTQSKDDNIEIPTKGCGFLGKYLVRALVFWAPALLVSLLFNNASMASQILQFFCGFFLLFGWTVNAGMAAYVNPRIALGSVLFYLGFHLFLINLQYSGVLPRALGRHSLTITGLFSYVPLDIFLKKILDFKIPHEIYITSAIAALCAAGCLTGALYRYHNPNPYRPKIGR